MWQSGWWMGCRNRQEWCRQNGNAQKEYEREKKNVCGRAISYEFMNEFKILYSSNAKIKIPNGESRTAR